MRARLTSSHFVGRESELAELEAALRDAEAAQPTLVLLSGESGVGKTRLVAELERRGADALVLRGAAVEQSEGELPYAPLLSALRPLVRERHAVLQALTAGSRAQLSALLPGLAEPGMPTTARDDPSAQLRLFEAILELLDLLSEQQPVALIFEDTHWADRSTRTFVSFLARSLRHERVMVLLTYRTDELHRRHPLRPLLAELERLDRSRRVELSPFDRVELTEALTDILGDAPGGDLVERLFARSEGNPLYTEELLAAGLDGRGATPQSLRDAFLLRIERLPLDAQRAARTIAVGRRLYESTIGEVSGIEQGRLSEALRQAVGEQVLVIDDDGCFLFRHALLREALYDDLLPGERADLHLALARVLERREARADDRAFQRATTVATHYAAAGDQPAALRSTVAAALAARDVHAYGESADLAERALELWPRVGDEEKTFELDHVGLLMLAASNHAISGEPARAEVLLQTALEELDPDVDRRRFASVLARLARTQWLLNRGQEGVETAQRALALLPDDDRGEERAKLLAWLARTRFLRGRFRDALSDGELALETAIDAGDHIAEVEVLNTLGMTRFAIGEDEEGERCLRRAVELARERNDVEGLAYAYSNLADMLNLRGRTLEAIEIAKEGLEAIPRRLGRSYDWVLLVLSELQFEAGEWQAARAHPLPSSSRVTGVLQLFSLLREVDVALGEGDEERAARSLEEARPLVAQSSEPQWIGPHGTGLAELRRRRGDLEGARQAIAETLDRIELCTDDVMRIARVTAAGARVEADIAQRGRDLGDRGQERDAVARARIHAERLTAVAQSGGPIERAWSMLGAAELTRARGRPDPRAWQRAANEWEQLVRPYLVAYAGWREAEAEVEAGDRPAAAASAAEALEIAQRLGARWLADEVVALGDRARLELSADGADGARPGDAARAPDDGEPFGLTPRERQVLALIAQGATNRQIGTSLYMAEKTASVHVSRILAKLGVHTRTQAAAVAHRMHLG